MQFSRRPLWSFADLQEVIPMRIQEVTGAVTVLLAALLCLPAPLAAAAPSALAEVAIASDLVTFQPNIPYGQVRVTLSGPRGFEVIESFGPEQTPAVALPGVDGLYKYELRFSPVTDDGIRRRLAAARAAGVEIAAVSDRLTVQRGTFSIARGAVIPSNLVEGLQPAKGSDSAGSQAVTGTPPNQGFVLSNSDGVIRNSLCVGFDCPDAPVFDDSTILLMENNTRIKFGDTSNSPFPNNDWEIEANSSSSGGAGYLGFNDCGTADNDGGCVTDLVFAVESGARASALYVESDGDIGIGTSNPVLDLHIVTGNTPSLRLDQDSSAGFGAQAWDIAGNEANFFIRDVTAGSRLPLRLLPGAPSNSIFLAANGDLGLGTSAPSRDVHLRRTDATDTTLLIENANASPRITQLRLLNAAGVQWDFRNNTVGDFAIVTSSLAGSQFLINRATGNVTIGADLIVNGAGGCTGCDEVFAPGYPIPAIDEHAAEMWQKGHLPGIGPSPVEEPINVFRKTAGILNELEKAHIYIQQLHERQMALEARIAALEAATGGNG